jgi:AcrR family transcriptional regulator
METTLTLQDIEDGARSARRRLLVDAAWRLVEDGGIERLTVRAVASEVGGSTQTVYSWCGGKDVLVGAVYRRALEAIGDELQQVGSEGGLPTLVQLALTYRDWALRHPRAYEVLARAAATEEAVVIRSSLAFDVLARAVECAVDRGELIGDDFHAIADALWAYTHGAVMLELAGYHPDAATAASRFMRGGMALFRGFGS